LLFLHILLDTACTGIYTPCVDAAILIPGANVHAPVSPKSHPARPRTAGAMACLRRAPDAPAAPRQRGGVPFGAPSPPS